MVTCSGNVLRMSWWFVFELICLFVLMISIAWCRDIFTCVKGAVTHTHDLQLFKCLRIVRGRVVAGRRNRWTYFFLRKFGLRTIAFVDIIKAGFAHTETDTCARQNRKTPSPLSLKNPFEYIHES